MGERGSHGGWIGFFLKRKFIRLWAFLKFTKFWRKSLLWSFVVGKVYWVLEEDFWGYEILFLAFSFLFFSEEFCEKMSFFFFLKLLTMQFLRWIFLPSSNIDSRECGKGVSSFLWFCYNFLTHLRLTRFLGKAYEKPPLT